MSRKSARPGSAVAFAMTVLIAQATAAQVGYRADPQGKDELWDITSKMEMPGMPFAMPAQTNRVCVVKGSEDEGIPKKDDCKVLETRRTGNRITYKMACKSGKNDYTATGESSWSGNAYQGRMQMVGKMEGEQMDMTMTYSGSRVGNCVSTIKQEVAAMKAQSEKAVADVCREGLDKLQWQLFVGDGTLTCQGRKTEFCQAVQRAAQAMREPAQYVAWKRKNPDLKTSFEKCDLDLAASARAACAEAAKRRNWNLVGGGDCDPEVLEQGAIHCKATPGRSPDPEFFPLCSRYVTLTRGNAPAASQGAAAPPGQQPPRAPAPQDPVQQGIDAVRKLLPF
jgi:hypothetical protein